MNKLSYILGTVAVTLIFATYIGNYALDKAHYNLGRVYSLGCGLGLVKARNFAYPLTIEEIVFCVEAGRAVQETFDSVIE